MDMKIVVAAAVLLGVTACQSTNQQGAAPAATTNSTMAAEPAPAKAEPAKPAAQPAAPTQTQVAAAPAEEAVPEGTVIYEDSFTFNWDLSSALRSAEDQVIVETPEDVKITEIPEDLDKWLSRIKENGGTVKAQANPQQGQFQTRGFLTALIDVVLYLVGVAKEEATYGPADDFDALLYYDKDTGKVTQIVMTKRK